MIEHAEDPTTERWVRGRRPTLAKTLCGRWVDHMRIAVRAESVTCQRCLKVAT